MLLLLLLLLLGGLGIPDAGGSDVADVGVAGGDDDGDGSCGDA